MKSPRLSYMVLQWECFRFVHHQLSLSVRCHGFSLKTHCLDLNQHSMINIHSISLYITWPEYQQPSGVTCPALISIIHQTPTSLRITPNAIYDDIHDTKLSSYPKVTSLHVHDTGMTPIAHPSGRGLGILRVLEVCANFCNTTTFIAKSRHINQKTRNSCIKQRYKLSMIRSRYTSN